MKKQTSNIHLKQPLRVVQSDYKRSPISNKTFFEIQDAEEVLVSVQLFETKAEAIHYIKENFPSVAFEVSEEEIGSPNIES